MLRCVKTGSRTDTPFRRFRFHDLRHLHAVEYLKVGGSLYDLSKRLGHTSVKTTEIYLDFLTADEAAKAKAGHRSLTSTKSRHITTVLGRPRGGFPRIARHRRRGREAEGGGLLNRYRVSSPIEGSNPSVSARTLN